MYTYTAGVIDHTHLKNKSLKSTYNYLNSSGRMKRDRDRENKGLKNSIVFSINNDRMRYSHRMSCIIKKSNIGRR